MMSLLKVTVAIPSELVKSMDKLVQDKKFLSRSEIIRQALMKYIMLAELNQEFEQLNHADSCNNSITMKLPAVLNDELSKVAKSMGLKRQHIIRMAIIEWLMKNVWKTSEEKDY